MKAGVNLLNFGPGATPESLARWASLAEALGFHLVMACDHVAITADVEDRYPAPLYDPFTTLAWLAGVTQKVELGTTVAIIPYRSPLLVARMAATLDRLSGGRFILGVGIGWAEQEFEALGLPFHRRGAMTDDYLEAIKTLWAEDVASHDGPFVSFRGVHTAPAPAQTPHPPIWVGGHSEAALRRTARLGDAWHPMRIRMAWLRDEGMPRLRQIAAEEGKPVPALCPRIKLNITPAPMPEDERELGVGTLDQVRADLAGLEALGAEYVLLDTYMDDPEATRSHEPAWGLLMTIAEKVLDLEHETVR